MVILHEFITLDGNVSLYLMQCLSKKFNAEVTIADNLKVSCSHTLSRLFLLQPQHIFIVVHIFIFSIFVARTILSSPKDFPCQFYPSLCRTPFIIIPLVSRNLIGFHYPIFTNVSSSSNWISPNNIVRNFGKGCSNII